MSINFLQFDFEPHNKEEAEKLIALLSEQGFDGFIEEGAMLVAFISEARFSQEDFGKILAKFSILAYSKTIIENINWNKKWEEEFEPVMVDGFAGIRAHFHKPLKSVEYEIVITPKMSFGTGHHATTFMMIQLMKDIGFKGKKVMDFGTGTGVLAILAEKMGATTVTAIDNDEWSITNAIENCNQNNCSVVTLRQADAIPIEGEYDIILANINLNVILANMPAIVSACNIQGKILLSGFLITDEQAIMNVAYTAGLKKKSLLRQKDWIAFLFEK
jgi:ribosomal protein L11 methyltransferase